MKINFTICSLLIFVQSFSQININQDKIKTLVQNYFQYERENIHVQFNKTTYVNNEMIAFKGYVLSNTKKTPNTDTSNIQLVIYNNQQQIVKKQLLYASMGSFSGETQLDEKFTTGKYYFQFYTNWMNNFTEDESFTQTVEIINKNEPYQLKSKEPNWATAKISLFPESGIIIKEIPNKIGIRITDCNKKGIKIKNGILFDSNSNEIARFNTNEMGNGSFNYIPKIDESYQVKIKTDKLNISAPLPNAQNTGITISYNNNLSNNILAVLIKTNETGLNYYQGKKFNLIIHQNGNIIQKEISFDDKNVEQIVKFSKLSLSNGVNSIRLIDENLDEVAERLVYIDNKTKPINTLQVKNVSNDSLSIIGNTDMKGANLNISILPIANIGIGHISTITGSFYLNSYLAIPEDDTYLYFDENNKNSKQDLDLLMLNQTQNKYRWNSIKLYLPKINHPFNQGVSISGRVEKKVNPNSQYKISLISVKNNFFEETTLDKNNEFKFEKIFALDSTVFFVQIMDEKNTIIDTKITTKITSFDTSYNIPKIWDNDICPITKETGELFTFSDFGLDKKTIHLKDIAIVNKYKAVKFNHKADNNSAKAIKVSDREFGSLINYLGQNGYRTGINSDNSVFIKNRNSAIVKDVDASPAVFIDDIFLQDLNLLYSYDITDVDEIYIDDFGISGFTPSGNGTLKIYLKDSTKKSFQKKNNKSLILTKGFTKQMEYKNSIFESQRESDYFGTLNWTPYIKIKDNSNYEIKFPRQNQQGILVQIEGFSNDGQLLSEIKTLPVTSNP